MTPDETSPSPVDDEWLAEMMAFDALLHASFTATERDTGGPTSQADVDDRGRSRLLLLLRMFEVAATSADPPGDVGGALGRHGPDEGRPLLGRFDVLDDLGSGGFGFVVRARDRLLGREVALKMPLPECALAPGDVRRFLREARAAARLDHPHIVRVFDAGELGPLGHFIASEFCEGPSLRRWLKSRTEPVPARLAARWMAAIADAIQHAHDHGVLHRDIKPDNVILAGSMVPDEFVPRLTDFGLAKLVEEAGDETRSEAQMGTPHYMAPEQAAGRRGEVGPATDVYALGATLYEILVGRPPFRGETGAETLRLVLEAEPVAPRSLRPGLPRDLETICLKCLRKEPERRYPSAAGLHDDLRRFLDGRPIRARRTSAAERAWRWCRRNKAVAGLLAAVFVLLAAVAGVASVGYVREAAARAVAEAAESKANGEADRAHAAEHEIRRQWYAASVNLMQPTWDAGQVSRLRELLTATELYPDRGFEWYYWRRLSHLERSGLIGHRASVRSVSWSSDGARLATASWDGTARIWDALRGRELHRLDGHAGRVWSVCWSPDGTRLAIGGEHAMARVWDIAVGRELLVLEGHTSRVISVAWSPDGTQLATASWDGTARVWDAAIGRELFALSGHTSEVWSVSWSPDGTRLATGARNGTARVWDATGGRELLTLTGHMGELRSLSWLPDGRRLASGSADGTAKVWDAAGGRELLTLMGHTGFIRSVSWSPDGTRLATGGDDGSARVWEAAGHEEVPRWDRQERAERDVPARNVFRGPLAQGFLRDWLLLLPLPLASGESGARALDRQQLPDEANLRPSPGERVSLGAGELVWRQHRSPEAVMDFNAVLGRATELGVVYAVCYIESDQVRDGLWLQVGSDDQAKVYLNGRQIYQCPVPRPLDTLDTIGPMSLKPGTNVLLLKVVNETANWEGIARLLDNTGGPAEGIRVKLTP